MHIRGDFHECLGITLAVSKFTPRRVASGFCTHNSINYRAHISCDAIYKYEYYLHIIFQNSLEHIIHNILSVRVCNKLVVIASYETYDILWYNGHKHEKSAPYMHHTAAVVRTIDMPAAGLFPCYTRTFS